MSTSPHTLVRADPRLRRLALFIVLGGALAAVLIIGYGLPSLEAWVLLVLAATLLGLGGYVVLMLWPG